MRVQARAPLRVDLCGGTLDLWPLYLFHASPVTLTCALRLFASATLTVIPASQVVEAGVEVRLAGNLGRKKILWRDWGSVSEGEEEAGYAWPFRLVRFWVEGFGGRERAGLQDWILEVGSDSPLGAGLGGSSVLAVAIAGALRAWGEASGVRQWNESLWERMRSDHGLVACLKDLEAIQISSPTGYQDYYASLLGGVQALSWQPGFPPVQSRSFKGSFLQEKAWEDRWMLVYSGASRNSGVNNWGIYRSFLSHEAKTVQFVNQVAQAAREAAQALNENQEGLFLEAVLKEARARLEYAPGMTTSAVQAAFEGRFYKFCGAGGGGCFWTLLGSGESREAREDFLKAQGMKVLPIGVSEAGLTVQVFDF